MQIIIGKYLGYRTIERTPRPGDTWEAFKVYEATLLIERPNDPPYTATVELAGKDFDFASLPAEQDYVAFEFSTQVRAKNDRAYVTLKAYRRVPEVEVLLTASRG